MKNDVIRHNRIMDLYKRAITGKYTWSQLFQQAKALGVSPSTAQSYLDAVEAMLIKVGKLKK